MKNIKSRTITFVICMVCILTFMKCNPTKEEAEKPNILLIYTDDQRYNTINALGNNEVQTPAMDRLSEMGLSFTNAHIMGGTSGAVCMPSRAMLMTGKSLFRLEMKGAVIPDDHVMMPELFQKKGYYTYGIGKWHNGKKAYARAFQDGGKIFFGGMSDHDKVPVFDFDTSGKYLEENKYIAGGFSSELFVDEAIGFLESYDNNRPFFLYVAFTAPHDPRMAPREYEDLYPRDQIKLPENFLPEHPFNNGEMKVRDEKLAPWPRTPEIVKDHIGAYYAMITHLDVQIGRLLDALEEQGCNNNTIIIMAGDNGLAVGQHGLMGKQNIYEHSIRVPFMISGPGIPENKRSEALVYINDIFPTLCDLTGIDQPENIYGQSLIPLIKNPDASFREEIFYAYRNFQRGVRTENGWKLIKYNVNNKDTLQLFNLNEDPWETNNLGPDPACAEKIKELTSLLKQEMKQSGDPMDLDRENWGKEKVFIPDIKVSHLAVGKSVKLNTEFSSKYTAGGNQGLTDGKHGTLEVQHDAWQGYEGNNLDAIVDLGGSTTIRLISARFLQAAGSWVFLPLKVEYLVSDDGKNWQTLTTIPYEKLQKTDKPGIHDFDYKFEKHNVRFVRVKAENMGVCPDWHAGAGGKAWIFVDEVVVK